MRTHTGRHVLVAMLGAAGLVAGSGVAAAQFNTLALPGTDDSREQVAVGYDLATVEVDAVDADSAAAEVTITNTTDAPMTCSEVTVTEAAIVNRSLAYLENNVLPPAPPLPGVNTGSLDVMLGSGSLGSLGLGDAGAIELDEIQQDQDRARLAGHYGTANVGVIAADDSTDLTVPLVVPTGDRTDFDAAALVTCTQDGQTYAFAGYENDDDADGGNGGGGSLSMGSLGS